MSNSQFAFLKKSNVPSQSEWQQSIDELNFDIKLKIDPELLPFEDEGFSPCTWGDTDDDVGFEIFYDPSADIHDDDEDLKRIIGDNDYCISMVWRSSMKDCAAVMIASTALAKGFDAVISYEGEKPDSIEKQIESTNAIIAEAKKET